MLMHLVYGFWHYIQFTSGYMIPPKQGSNLFQNSVLNMWPRENCYISGYEGPNELLLEVPDREHSLIYVVKFQTQRSNNFSDTTETVSEISVEEIGKLGLPVSEASLHCFQKRSTLYKSPWRGPSFYLIRSLKFQVFKIRFYVTNPRLANSGTRTDISNR